MRDRKNFISQYALMRQLTQMAEQNKLVEQSPTREMLEFSRMQVLTNAQLNDTMSHIKVPPEDIKAFYDANRDRFSQVQRQGALHLVRRRRRGRGGKEEPHRARGAPENRSLAQADSRRRRFREDGAAALRRPDLRRQRRRFRQYSAQRQPARRRPQRHLRAQAGRGERTGAAAQRLLPVPRREGRSPSRSNRCATRSSTSSRRSAFASGWRKRSAPSMPSSKTADSTACRRPSRSLPRLPSKSVPPAVRTEAKLQPV